MNDIYYIIEVSTDRPGVLAHAYNHIYSRGRVQEDAVWG
jgi:hypothetical protein